MSTENKPSRNEDEYFAKQNAELVIQQRARLAAEQSEAERRTHLNKCPRDGYDLRVAELQGVQVETCDHCGGLWLDRGELEVIASHQDRPGLLGRFFGDVLTGLRTTHMPKDADRNVRHEPGNPLA
jgi:uncharacterized protein